MPANRKIEQALARLSLDQREREFHHHSYVSHIFRSYTGLTPTEYRKQNYRKHFEEGASH